MNRANPLGALVGAVLVAVLYEQGGLLRVLAVAAILAVLLYRPAGRPNALAGLLDTLSGVLRSVGGG
jgi:hypothetical protein